MAINKALFNIKGMTRDMAASKFSPEYAFENKNLRIIATDDNTSFGLVNEKGTAATGVVVEGTPIGQEIINESLILFTTSDTGDAVITLNVPTGDTASLPDGSGTVEIQVTSNFGDRIYKFRMDGNTLNETLLYSGNLGFSAGSPIESIGVYEDDKIQKIYWTDNLNQPRVINIEDANRIWTNDSFDFVPNINDEAVITITRNDNSFGSFAPGVIQYCFTYYNLYGPETNIFYTTPLYYVSHSTRGASPDETVSCSFTIKIEDYNSDFDYLRIYSILRTSEDAVPQVRQVADINLRGTSGDIIYTDSGVEGAAIDPTDLLFVGGEPVSVGTMAHKDNTLFLGDISMKRNPISRDIKTDCQSLSITTVGKTLKLPDNDNVGNYSYTSQLNKSNEDITYYRRGECYRLGLQAQHYTGRWSDVVFIKDYTVSDKITPNGSDVTVPNLTTTVGSAIIDKLLAGGYVKIRPMVVFPDENNRNIICEGVVCPTVYNVEDRYTNGPYAQASWFFRPNAPKAINTGATSGDMTTSFLTNYTTTGRWAEFRHNRPIPANNVPNAEIQCISNTPDKPILSQHNVGSSYVEPSSADSWVTLNRECFYVDQSVFTMHSPEIEFGSTLSALDTSSFKFRIIGYVPINASYSDIDIQATAPLNYARGSNASSLWSTNPDEVGYFYYWTTAPGFSRKKVVCSTARPGFGWRNMLSGTMWYDELADSIRDNYKFKPVGFVVYPWNRAVLNNSSINNDKNASILEHKKMSIVRFSKNSIMLDDNKVWTGTISGATTFNSDVVSMIKVHSPSSGMSDINYYGNIDKLIVHHNKPKGDFNLWDWNVDDIGIFGDTGSTITGNIAESASAAYPIVIQDNGHGGHSLLSNATTFNKSSSDGSDDVKEYNNVRVSGTDNSGKDVYMYLTGRSHIDTTYSLGRYTYFMSKTSASDPVSMKYKSTPHLVMALNYSGTNQVVLPTHSNINSATESYGEDVFWGGSNGVTQSSISVEMTDGYLWLGELYRDDLTSATRFGGTSEEAIENNKWTPAGEPVSIENQSSVTLVWSQGDTYYQRYDCLKTYPFTMEDVNSVSDTLSFMCETRINIDGRYDKNRGQLSNLYATPANSNLINPVYSQKNNYFTYNGYNTNKVNSTYFPNTITWTKTKTNGEVVDQWTNITLASILDVDGDKGKVRALRRFNNDIISFQDRGISQIMYNDNVQIATTTGVPIEIANSGKVSGKRYISNHIGCYNKWSICSAPAGLYFIDDIGKDIYLFNGQLNNLSDQLGFHSWVVQNFPTMEIWNPRDFATKGEITYYDKINGDVLFITGDTCLAFSEALGHFSSFYSYERTPYFGSLGDRGIMWHLDNSIGTVLSSSNKYQAWLFREGNYNSYFNVYQPFYTTIVVNEHPLVDKVFNNLEYRGDTFSPGGEYLHANTFDRLETWNEYQRGIANLNDTTDWGYTTSNLKKKFRIWRAIIPRNTTNPTYRRDRMRNPWLYLKLSKEASNSNKTILHDLVVHYFE